MLFITVQQKVDRLEREASTGEKDPDVDSYTASGKPVQKTKCKECHS